MKKSNKALTKKQELFCTFYVLTRNAKEAAARAGYAIMPERAGVMLLKNPDVAEEISRLQNQDVCRDQEIVDGLRRLAFGSVTDSIRLLFCGDDLDLSALEAMDLFNVAEIKRPKSGGMEIKFFDRFKALEQLSQIEHGKNSSDAEIFYSAIAMGAEKTADEAG